MRYRITSQNHVFLLLEPTLYNVNELHAMACVHRLNQIQKELISSAHLRSNKKAIRLLVAFDPASVDVIFRVIGDVSII